MKETDVRSINIYQVLKHSAISSKRMFSSRPGLLQRDHADISKADGQAAS